MRDGGLLDAIQTRIIALKETELAGFVAFGRDFVVSNGTSTPRLVVIAGQNRKIFRTDQTEIRAIGVTFQVWGSSETVTDTQAGLIDSLLNEWSEKPSAIQLDDVSAVREMTIIGQVKTHEQPALWSVRITTEWEIAIGRLTV